MRESNELNTNEIREILRKGWMTHDAMWFYNVNKEFGIDATNRINLAAIDGMGAIEVGRYKKILGYDKNKKFTSFDEFKVFFKQVFEIIKPDFMDFEYSVSEKNIIRWKWANCFAYNGVSQIGVVDNYQCGILRRIESWLKTLGIPYTIEPEIKGCLMHTNGKCEGEFHFNFD